MSPDLDILILPVDTDARERGRIHGARFASQIAEAASIRARLCLEVGALETAAAVRETARAHLPVLEAYDRDLYDELVGIAEGAELDPADIVTLNHYTDLRDLDPTAPLHYSDECSVLYAPHGAHSSLLAMTWDTHASATRFGLLLGVPEHEARDGSVRPAAWLLSIVGCLGMAGLNARGLGLVVNNLKSTDARLGAVWPAVVRRALAESSTAGARHVLETCPMSSGRHYLVADRESALGLEVSGRQRAVVFDGPREQTWFHTNHCLDASVAAVTKIAPNSTTWPRYATLERSLRESPVVESLEDAWHRLSLVSAPGDVTRHDQFATCAAIAMELGTPRAWARRGPVEGKSHQAIGFDAQGACVVSLRE